MGSHADKSIFSNSTLCYSLPLFTAYIGQTSMPYLVSVCRPQYQVCSPLEIPHRFKWNRFAGLQEGPGARISSDLCSEQHNNMAKEDIRAIGGETSMTKVLKKLTNQKDQWRK